MNEEHPENGKTWAYLHGELTGPERAAWEAEQRRDPERARAMKAARQADATLRLALPHTGQPEEELVDQILRAYEQEQAAPAEAPGTLFAALRGWWGWPAWATAIVLAGALGLAGWLRPAQAALVTITFLAVWNDYLWPSLTIGGNPAWYPIAFILNSVTGVSLSGAFLVVLMILSPPALVFILLQRYFVQGLVASGLKG